MIPKNAPSNRWKRPVTFREATGVSEPSYYRLKKSGALKTAKLNGIVFVDAESFDRDLAAQLLTGEGKV